MRAETPRHFRPLQSRERFRRNASTAQDYPALGVSDLASELISASSCSRPVSRSIGKPLADDPTESPHRALRVVNPERDALVVAEIELCEVALQVLFAHMVIKRRQCRA